MLLNTYQPRYVNFCLIAPLESSMAYLPTENRYDEMIYNRCGRSGLLLPAISLGLWHNFGEDKSTAAAREICRTAFDLGITHFDLANNYGPPPGSAETLFGEILRNDFRGLRDELVISTKAGYRMWPGPYGEWGSRKYLLSSLDQSLKRMGLDYVDIFYSHRFDPNTPLEETMLALDSAVRQGRRSMSGSRPTTASAPARHSPSCVSSRRPASSTSRAIPCSTAGSRRTGCSTRSKISAWAPSFSRRWRRAMLTTKYLDGIPEESRAAQGKSLRTSFLNEDNIARIRSLNGIAERRGQTLAQMALAWVLRGGRVTSALIGASRPEQVVDCVGALKNLSFTAEELAEIDRFAGEGNLNIWAASAERKGPSR